MPNLRCESHHRICNLRYGMSAYIGFCCSYSGLTDFIDTIPRLLYTKPTSKSQTNNSYDYETFVILLSAGEDYLSGLLIHIFPCMDLASISAVVRS